MKRQPSDNNLSGSLLDRIEEKRDHFTPKLGRLASYITLHYRDVAFMSISELARASGVSDATVTRFSTALGYSGFPDMNRDLQQNIQTQLNTVERFNITFNVNHRRDPKPGFEEAIFQEAQNVQRLMETIRKETFNRVVDRMVRASRIGLIGLQASASLVEYFYFGLEKIAPPVVRITNGDGHAHVLINQLGEGCLVFLFLFPRYPRLAVELASYAKDRGAEVVAVTNSYLSPAAKLADDTLLVQLPVTSFIDSYSPSVALIHILVKEFAARNPERTKKRLEMYEEITRRQRTFTE
ncbi:MAG: MurR/RpiR family transcriptional regulator [Deltaproteobacteria bacterium]|nr:MurR/RpiR family transcriptional regulator [Deltaproteobacteria bacterium]